MGGAVEADSIWLMQAPIDRANDAIRTMLDERPDWRKYYGGTKAEVAQGQLTVALTSEAPGDLVDEVTRVGGGIKLVISTARFSEIELMQAAVRIVQSTPGFTGASVDPGGAGLVVQVESLGRAKSIAPDPHVLEYREQLASIPAAATRQADSSAAPGWRAGARIRSFGCTTGYAVRKDGLDYLQLEGHHAR